MNILVQAYHANLSMSLSPSLSLPTHPSDPIIIIQLIFFFKITAFILPQSDYSIIFESQIIILNAQWPLSRVFILTFYHFTLVLICLSTRFKQTIYKTCQDLAQDKRISRI